MFARGLIAIGMSLALWVGPALGQEEVSVEPVEEVIYPASDWSEGVLVPQSVAAATSLIDDAMSRELDDEMGETRQIVIIHKGRLVAEDYREGYTPDTKLVSWSMAKSITHAFVGRAVHEGLIEDIDAPMPGPWTEDDPRSQITWRQWMTMTDGLDYTEVGELDINKNDVVQMMFGSGRYDMIEYVKDLPQIHEAGTHWNYSTAGFHTISRALQRQIFFGPGGLKTVPGPEGTYCNSRYKKYRTALAKVLETERAGQHRDEAATAVRRLHEAELNKCGHFQWLDATLFTPLGMDAQPEFDAAGTFLGGSLVYASARDFARFGYLYLRDGVWNGERLLPEGWVDFARTKTSGTNSNVYGAGWWITPPEGEEPTHAQSAKSAPYDAFHAGGNEGQTIWVVPSKDLVIVRLGLMSNAPENWAALYEWNQKVARAFPNVE